MKFKKFDIVLVNFPFTDLTKMKKRPALFIKTLEGENNILCQITTKRRNIQKDEVSLKKEQCNGNIRFNSYIYTDMIFTLHQKLTYNNIGEIIDSTIKDSISSKIKNLFND
jgi:mRNA interferase MazF